jgi:HEAT repeat protein
LIAGVEILAAAQLAVISALAVLLTGRRIAVARGDRRRERLLERYRDSVLEFVGMDDEHPPDELRDLRTTEQREAVSTLLAQYTSEVKGEPKRRVAEFADQQGYAAAAIADLRALRAWRRGTAAKTLGDFAVPAAAGELADLLAGDRSAEVRVTSARALGRAGGAAAAAALVAACGRGVPAGVAAQALLDIGPESMPWVLGSLSSPRAAVRETACRVIGLTGASGEWDVVPPLEQAATSDESVPVRVAACESLGRVGGREAALALVGATSDGEADVRRAACDAAARLAAPELAGAVRRALDDSSADVRRSAARAAVTLGVAAVRFSEFQHEAEAEMAWGWS